MNPGVFDELTRRFAGRFSRRILLGGALGTLALGSTLPHGRARADTSCADLRRFTSWDQMGSCDNVVQTKEPSFDWCSVPPLDQLGQPVPPRQSSNPLAILPELSMIADLVAFRDASGAANWLPACQAHDRCYATCGKTHDECDRSFVNDMSLACVEAYPAWWQAPMLLRCGAKAEAYYRAVSWWGVDPYRKLQLEHCGCCEDSTSSDPTEAAGNDSGKASWPTDRHDTATGLYLWIGSATAWGIPGINGMPDWVACDDARDYCLLGYTGGDEVLVDVDDFEVVGTIAEWYPDPKEALLTLGMTEEVADQILGI